MTGFIILVVIAVLIALGVIVLKSNAGVVALALMSGFVLNIFVGSEISIAIRGVVPGVSELGISIARILCILLPGILVLWFLRRTSSGPVSLVNVPLAILSGLVALLFSVPQLPGSLQANLTNTTFWEYVRQYQVVLVSATLFVATVQFWLMRPRNERKHKKAKH